MSEEDEFDAFCVKCCLSLEDAFVTRDVMFSDVSSCVMMNITKPS